MPPPPPSATGSDSGYRPAVLSRSAGKPRHRTPVMRRFAADLGTQSQVAAHQRRDHRPVRRFEVIEATPVDHHRAVQDDGERQRCRVTYGRNPGPRESGCLANQCRRPGPTRTRRRSRIRFGSVRQYPGPHHQHHGPLRWSLRTTARPISTSEGRSVECEMSNSVAE